MGLDDDFERARTSKLASDAATAAQLKREENERARVEAERIELETKKLSELKDVLESQARATLGRLGLSIFVGWPEGIERKGRLYASIASYVHDSSDHSYTYLDNNDLYENPNAAVYTTYFCPYLFFVSRQLEWFAVDYGAKSKKFGLKYYKKYYQTPQPDTKPNIEVGAWSLNAKHIGVEAGEAASELIQLLGRDEIPFAKSTEMAGWLPKIISDSTKIFSRLTRILR